MASKSTHQVVVKGKTFTGTEKAVTEVKEMADRNGYEVGKVTNGR